MKHWSNFIEIVFRKKLWLNISCLFGTFLWTLFVIRIVINFHCFLCASKCSSFFVVLVLLRKPLFVLHNASNFRVELTHFSPVSHFYTPWKRQKTFGSWPPPLPPLICTCTCAYEGVRNVSLEVFVTVFWSIVNRSSQLF